MQRNLQPRAILLLILLAVFVSFLPALQHELLLWDDIEILTENINTRSLSIENIAKMFTTKNVGTYVPLTVLSLAIERHFFGLNPYVFHLVNILLHLAVVWAVFLFSRNIGLPPRAAAVAAFIFGVHPMHIESVVWVSQRKDVLSSLFYILSLRSYFLYLQKGGMRPYIQSLLFGVLSILAKPMAYSLPFALFLCDYLSSKEISKETLLNKFPFMVLIGAVSVFTLHGIPTESLYGLGQSLLLQVYALTFYIGKFILPLPLLPFYDFPVPVVVSSLPYRWALLMMISIVIFCWIQRKDKIFVFAWAFYLISICVLIIRIPWNFGNNTILADRFMYLPSAGFCLYLGFMIDKLLLNRNDYLKRLLTVVLVASGLIVMFMTYSQSKIWKNDVSLWTHAQKYYPESYLIYMNRAKAYAQHKQYELAKEDYEKLERLRPQDPKVHFVRADFFAEMGNYSLSLSEFDKAAALDPSESEIYFRRGNLYYRMSKRQQAAADYKQAISLNPKHSKAYYNLGLYYEDEGDDAQALIYYTKAIDCEPRNTLALNNRGLLYLKVENFALAMQDFNSIVKLDVHNPQAHNNKGIVLFKTGQYPQALDEFNKALMMDANYADAQRNRQVVLNMK